MSRQNDFDAQFNKIQTGIEKLYVIYSGISARLDGMDKRFFSIDQRFDSIDQRLNAMDQRFDAMDQRFDRLEEKVDQNHDELKTINGKLDDRITALETWRNSYSR